LRCLQLILVLLSAIAAAFGGASAQQNIGLTAAAHNDGSRGLSGATGPLAVRDSVYRDEVVHTGVDSTAKLILLDSSTLGVGPVSRVALDQFVSVGEMNEQKMAVNLTEGVFGFTTGALNKRGLHHFDAAIGVRGTVLDIGAQSALTRATLVEGSALFCPRRPGSPSSSRCATVRGPLAASAGRTAIASTSRAPARPRRSKREGARA
jgi:hypothetical protein